MIAELEQFPVTGGERAQGGISYHNEKHPESLKEMEALMDSRTVTCYMCVLNCAHYQYGQKTQPRLPRSTALLIISHCWYFTPAGECRRRPGGQQLSRSMIDISASFTLSLRPKAWLQHWVSSSSAVSHARRCNSSLLIALAQLECSEVRRTGGLMGVWVWAHARTHTRTHTSCRWPSWHILCVIDFTSQLHFSHE